MIGVAAVDIPAGREVRWDYDNSSGRPFRAAMLARGITVKELDSPEYAEVWTVADDAMAQGPVRPDAEYPYATIGELGLGIETVRGREIVTEARRGGRKRRHGDSAMAADEISVASDAPT